MKAKTGCAVFLCLMGCMTGAAESVGIDGSIESDPIDLQKYDRTIGVCHLSANPYDPTSAQNSMSPPLAVKLYYYNFEKNNIQGSVSVSVLQMPAHGTLLDGGKGNYAYLPEKGYLGNDRATLLVEVGGKKVRMEYFFRVMTSVQEGEGVDPYADNCQEKVRVWKISTATDENGNRFIPAVDYQSLAASAVGTAAPDAAVLADVLGTNVQNSLTIDPSLVTLNIADLPGGAVGQTVETNITLDDNAAGNNWFIDTTPGLNEEYLPTSNPNEWVAKAGSDAAGKMDMPSVLLHEYGHALGIEHSADNHGYMSTTLTVGSQMVSSFITTQHVADCFT